MREALLLLTLLAILSGCSQGPERRHRLAEPAATPATDLALSAAVAAEPRVNCIRNLAGRTVGFALESDGTVRRHSLHDGEALHFRDRGQALVRFASVSDSRRIRSRSYLLDLAPDGDCRHVFRLDGSGGPDLYGSGG